MRPLSAVLVLSILFVLGCVIGSNETASSRSGDEAVLEDATDANGQMMLCGFEEDSVHARSAMNYYDRRADSGIGRILHLIDEQRGYTRNAPKSSVARARLSQRDEGFVSDPLSWDKLREPRRAMAKARVDRSVAQLDLVPATRVEKHGKEVWLLGEKKRGLRPTGGEPFTPRPLKRFLADWAAYSSAATEPDDNNWTDDFLDHAEDQQYGLIVVDYPVILADNPGSRVPIVGRGTVFYTLRGRVPRRLRAHTLLDAKLEAEKFVSQRLASRQASFNRRVQFASATGRRF